ncbi:MAG: hypothetical protein QXX23_06940 [Thermoplasmata archaeon]
MFFIVYDLKKFSRYFIATPIAAIITTIITISKIVDDKPSVLLIPCVTFADMLLFAGNVGTNVPPSIPIKKYATTIRTMTTTAALAMFRKVSLLNSPPPPPPPPFDDL